jgi:SNF2 family DNA or RNA helicase
VTSFQVSQAHQALLIPCTCKQVETLFPSAPTIQINGTAYYVLPHNTRTQIQLRAAEIEAPAPILSYYDWKSADGLTPFQVQKNTAALATSYQRAYILNDLGTGKTRAMLWAWNYLHKAKVAKKLLVVAPLSTLKFVWLHEISMTMPHVKAAVLHGSRGRRLALLDSDADIFIINHDGLKTILPELDRRTDIDTMIIDELPNYRNNSLRSKRMRIFAQRFVWVWGLTGRPMPNKPTDVWAQCKIITPGTCPKYFRYAQTALMQQIDIYKWVPRDGAVETALSWMRPAVRYSLDDVVELPPAILRTIDVEMSAEQATTYRRLANEYMVLVREQKITAANAGVALGKLLQIAVGYVYSNNPQYVTLDSTPRQEKLLEILADVSGKAIVFAPWRHVIDNLSVLLTENEIEHAIVHGDVPVGKRGEIFNAFQNTTQYQVLLAHPETMAHGLTLTAAATMVWYAPIPSLDIYEQACARIRRPSQQSKQLYLHLQATAVERRIYTLLRQKQKLQNEFLDLLKTNQEEQDRGEEKRENGYREVG